MRWNPAIEGWDRDAKIGSNVFGCGSALEELFGGLEFGGGHFEFSAADSSLSFSGIESSLRGC